MTRYAEPYAQPSLPPARQNPRHIFASQMLHRREKVAPQFGEAMLLAHGQRPLQAAGTRVQAPLQGEARKKLQPRPVPNLGSFSQQVLGPEVRGA